MLTSVREANTNLVRTEDAPSYSLSSKMGTASDLKLGTVKRVAEARLPTEFAEFRIIGYRSLRAKSSSCFVLGQLRDDRPSLVRIHLQCMTGDVFGSLKCDCGRQLRAAMKLIASEGHGAIIYQQQEGRGIGIINKIRAYALQDDGADTIEANKTFGFGSRLATVRSVRRSFPRPGAPAVRMMTNNPRFLANISAT